MSSPIKPLADRVVAVRKEARTQTASGIYLPDTAKEKPTMAEVIAVGPDVQTLKVGNTIVYKDYSQTELQVNDQDYIIVREADVLATV